LESREKHTVVIFECNTSPTEICGTWIQCDFSRQMSYRQVTFVLLV
jgi:hypothetical protein